MIVEGVGKQKPSSSLVVLSRDDLRILKVHAEDQARHRGYQDRSDMWGNGIASAIVDPVVGELSRAVRPIYCGLLGEAALGRLIERRTGVAARSDLTLHGGDKGVDLTAAGLTIQVKTRQTFVERSLVRVGYIGNARVLKSPCRVYAFCHWAGGHRVYVLGWIWQVDMYGMSVVDGAGNWENVLVKDEDLLPVSRLMSEIKARKAGTP